MTKTAIKTKKVETTVDAPIVNAVIADFNNNGKPPETVGQMIDINSLEPSPTNPRKRFPQSSIDELAISIREQGIIEPLIVRLNYQTTEDDRRVPFEIVCGERRWRAAQAIGDGLSLAFVPCIVRDLTDEQVIDIQIHENLHREDVHPMDEAYGYKFLQDKLGCDIKELAIRVGKSESFVLNRLKLNNLIEEAQQDVEEGILPLIYALEIAKYPPDVQPEILQNAYDQDWVYDKSGNGGHYVANKEILEPFSEFKSWINNEILLRLTEAPFDTKATNLRKDGLACTACPDRTGVNAGLFDSDLIKKKDSCLNKVCFEQKKDALIQLTRERVAHDANIQMDEVAFVNTDRYGNENGFLGYAAFIQIKEKADGYYESKKRCEHTKPAINLSPKDYGKEVEICVAANCKTHRGKSATSSSASPKDDVNAREKELDLKRQRREEIFDMMVADMVRKQVFRRSAEKFAGEFLISHATPAFLSELLIKLWETSSSGPDGTTKSVIVKGIMQDITDEPDGFCWGSYGQEKPKDAIPTLSERNQKLMLFLFIHGNKGNTYSDCWRSQAEVKALAKHYGIDYRLLDAQCRVAAAELKAKKQIDLFKTYLLAVEGGADESTVKIPRVWSENWKPKE